MVVIVGTTADEKDVVVTEGAGAFAVAEVVVTDGLLD